MTTLEKNKRDPDDVVNLLKEVEKKLGVHFETNDLKEIKTFGEFCDLVFSKLSLPKNSDSANQQAFSKLRIAISAIKGIDKKEILPETRLDSLFPRSGRKKAIKELEYTLGFNLKVLRPFILIEIILLFSFLGAIVFLFINFIYGMEMLALFFIINTVAFKTGKEFNAETLGDLAKKITKENFRKAKRNPETINEEDVFRQLQLLFGKSYLREDEEITRETRIF
jgi:hypothetical protein